MLLCVIGVSFFGKALELYHNQHKEVLAIPEKRNLGLLLVDKTLFRERLLSSPLRCLEVRTSKYIQKKKKKVQLILLLFGLKII